MRNGGERLGDVAGARLSKPVPQLPFPRTLAFKSISTATTWPCRAAKRRGVAPSWRNDTVSTGTPIPMCTSPLACWHRETASPDTLCMAV